MYKSSPIIHAFLTVRMKSSRLKKKALLKLGKLTILERAVINLSASNYINDVIILTSTNKDDNPIVDLCKKRNLKFFRGSEDDVLDRFLKGARVNKTDIIVRATGDNPFVSFEIADFLIKSHLDKNATDGDAITTKMLQTMMPKAANQDVPVKRKWDDDEKRSAYLVCEVFSPPRTSQRARELGKGGGLESRYSS